MVLRRTCWLSEQSYRDTSRGSLQLRPPRLSHPWLYPAPPRPETGTWPFRRHRLHPPPLRRSSNLAAGQSVIATSGEHSGDRLQLGCFFCSWTPTGESAQLSAMARSYHAPVLDQLASGKNCILSNQSEQALFEH